MRRCIPGNVGDIQMRTENQMLDEVVIRGNRPVYKATASGLMVNIQGTILGKIGTAEDVLTHVPGVVRKGGIFEVFGKGTPIIYLNGKKLRDLSELGRLSSTDIKYIELITEPGAAYDATVNAVVNIRTAKRQGDGLGLAYRQTYSQAHQNEFLEQLDINYRYHDLDLFGSLYYGLSHGREEQRNNQKVSGEHTLELDENLIIKSKNEDFMGTFGFNYDVNESHSFGASYTGSLPVYSKAGWVTNMDVRRDGSKVDRLLNVFSFTGKKRPTNDLSVYYKGNIGKVSIGWDGNAYFRKTGNDQTSQESGGLDDERFLTTSYTADNKLLASKIVFTIPIWKGDLQVGSEYTDINRRNIYRIEAEGEDLPTNSDDKVKEHNIAMFVAYSFKLEKLQVDAGLRYEHVSTDYYDHNIYVAEQSKTYDNVFPHVSLSFPIKK